ncbi:hypothetical protein ACFRAM_17220 [Paenibacillus sp. NPDC056722]|uniref:hypothetical protein n=1 Tax=Paenibacillus sp. NPDC056722 TaxID=3345924 RepID=UPI0036BCC606
MREAGWEKERAITTPPRALTDRSQWRSIAEQNGISKEIFINRCAKGWSPEQAATEPWMTRGRRVAWMKKNRPAKRKYSDELLQRAASNGVSKDIFYKRVSLG